MSARIDLHIHSRYSEDGDLPVADLFALAESRGLAAISITDHDSIESIPDARACSGTSPVHYVPGAEITTVLPEDGSQQHILGYFIDPASPDLQAILKTIQEYRTAIAVKRMEALRAQGIFMDADRVWKMADGRAPAATSIMREAIGAPENAGLDFLETYRTGPKSDNPLMNFYRDYLVEGKPGYVNFESIPTARGIRAILDAGGIPILAHPVFVKNRSLLDVIAGNGIMGIEAISSYHSPEEIEFFTAYARSRRLLITAGSDFHGPTTKPKVAMGGVENNYLQLYLDLREAHEAMRAK
ncbi:MAG: PHP domain-containing protein [Spirochaetes bacterium]|nr:MAG: PHP domain-containing protein [Spirochaetota bacterium]